ncbi:MAG: penicillin-binding protein 2 [Pseudomonadota bacterium]|nr:MAG: penicillin-binding protein 2 [Pseudomonadota bacterium]
MLNIPLKDYFRETRVFNSRLSAAAIIMAILSLLLVARLTYLQILSYRHYSTLSQANRVRPLPIPPVRGLIVDRHGVVLAQNYPVHTLEIIPEQVDNMKSLLAELKGLVRITEGDEKSFRKQLRERPRFEALTLRTHLSDEEAARIAVRRPHLNGVELQARLQRHYPLGGLGVHAVGYVARISDQDLERIDKTAYRGTRHIGKLGAEAAYEHLLLGQVGFEKVETTARGRALRTLERIAPVAGQNLYLGIDARLQAIAEEALVGRRGAVVALEPVTGTVLAFTSTPTYDPNPFVNGIETDAYKALLDNPNKPLINRALNGQYAPGSTIKVFFGLLGLEDDRFDTSKPLNCPGHYSLPGSSHVFRDWRKGGHGVIGLHEAVVQSCDVYFYRLATAVGPEALRDFLAPFGFGARTGVDLPNESEGLLPSPKWKAARGQKWYPGETVVTGIGQGMLLATPLQLASAVATLANSGVRVRPHLLLAQQDAKGVQRIEAPTRTAGAIELRVRAHLNEIVRHMVGVVHDNKGTAYRIGWDAPYKIAGKTGTSQVKSIAQGAAYVAEATPEHLRDHALFIAFAPAEDPRVAVAVVVENGGHGGSVAAPIARKVMDYAILGRVQPPAKPALRSEHEE